MSDLIDRQAAIDEIVFGKEMLNRVLDDMDVVGVDREKYAWGLGLIESLIDDIRELPSARPERKTGQWIKIHWKAYRCSECNRASEYSTDYCPNCGVKMEGEDNATD